MGNPSTRDDAATELPPSGRPRKRAGHIWRRALLTMAFLLAALSGIWFLGVRPSLQHQAVLQINRTMNQAETEMFQILSADVYRSPRNILVSEKLISNALTFHNADESQDWQVIVTPASVAITLSFSGCGQNCTLTAVLNVGNSPENDAQLQVTHAHAQGMLALVLSDNELANALQSNLQIFNRSLILLRMKITLLEHAINVHLH